MMKYLVLFILVLTLAGCSTKEIKQSEIDIQEEPLPAFDDKTVLEEPKLNVSSEAKKEEPVVTPDAKQLFDKNIKINSFSYNYYGPPNDALGINYGFFGNRGKTALTRASRLSDGNYYDFVYLNLSSKTAAAYCEAVDCIVKGPLEVDFNSYINPTPIDFVNSIAGASIKGTETIEGRKVAVVPYMNKKGLNGTMWVEMTYGMPLKVILDGTKYEFREANFNTLTEKDVIPKN